MFFIPGFLVAIATFPGIIVHEAGHMLACKLRHVAVFDVRFFRFANPPGFVIHEEITDFNTAFLVAVGPLIANTLLCVLICFPTYLPMRFFGVSSAFSYLLLWLGISIGMHAFPSTHDAHNLYQQAKRAARSANPLAILSFPLVAAIYLANALSVVWFDYIYGIFIGYYLPGIIFR
jgi:hypothetical protein